MTTPTCVPLPDRGVLRIAGDDARPFLQGLISNDVQHVGPDRTIWAAFLTAQGRYLHDFFLCAPESDLLLDGEAARLDDLKRRLSIYRLRSRVTIDNATPAFRAWALFGEQAAAALGLPADQPGATCAFAGGVAFVDPRLASAGLRALLPIETGAAALAERGFAEGDRLAYERRRIALGLPDGSRDSVVDKSLLLECGFDELHGIDWQKGCFLGQELTARTRYRGLVKRRLVPVAADGPLPSPGVAITIDGKEVGEVRSGADGLALALVRVEALQAAATGAGELRAGEARLVPRPPDWARFVVAERS